MSKTKISLTDGRLFDFTNPDPGLIDLREICDVLSVTPRFNGRARFADGSVYSVAQHSLLVADIVANVSPGDKAAYLWALLHDAHEAFTGDLTTPLKHAIGLQRVERIKADIDHAICEAVGFDWRHRSEVRYLVSRCDQIAFSTEVERFFTTTHQFGKRPAAWRVRIEKQSDAHQMSVTLYLRIRRALASYVGKWEGVAA